MKLLVGLGNPGEKYARNRHNVGFMAVQTIATEHRMPAWRRRFSGMITEGEIGDQRCMLLMPLTYMNDSGQSVGEAARFLKVAEADVIVIHDEIDLAPGKLKVKTGGGVAGHNGLRSITAHIGNDYERVRIGVGHPGSKDAVVHYVLHDFHKAEFEGWLDPMLSAMATAAPLLIKGQPDRFMNEVARLTRPEDERRSRPETPVAPKPATPKPNTPTPVGDPGNKRAGAMADNLRKWLAGRKGGA
jgi:peptidyl-tRNA hydrolase, PTH1 family